VVSTYPGVQVVGGLLPGGVLHRIGEGDPDVPGVDPVSYELDASESVRRLANAKYTYLRDIYTDFTRRRRRATRSVGRLTRDAWLKPLLRELRYEAYEPLPDGITVQDTSFPVSHWWRRSVPLHLLPWQTDLDRRVGRGIAGAAPHDMVQRLLNQSDRHLWAVLTNGRRLRLLRDSTSLVGSSFIEFDLEAIFEAELFPDFVLLFRTAHATRLEPRDDQTGPQSCLLEQWRSYGARQGERALVRLRDGVEAALEILGTGFLTHPANQRLRDDVGGPLSLADFKRCLLRLVYRLLFWCVAEDRELLLHPDASPAARQRYVAYLSSQRLRRLAVARRHSRHGDLWQAVRLVFGILGSEAGSPTVGLPGLGGLFEDTALDGPLRDAQLTNSALLRAVEALSVLARPRGGRQLVDFAHLGAEELGSVYEALLELHPCWDEPGRRFHFVRVGGNDRKRTGAYYTPAALVDSLLDQVLDPLLDEACAEPTTAARVDALLGLTVCDPACGSGHFLIAAARRIASRVAAEKTDELEPTLDAVRTALRAVVGRCCFGVDVNEMAVELTRVGLWLEAMEPGKPLGYLDGNIRVGNSLLGATPALLAAGLPDAAFTRLDGDEPAVVNALRRQNAAERHGRRPLGDLPGVDNLDLGREAAEIAHLAPCESLADVHVQAARGAQLDGERARKRLLADAWCAAFVAPRITATRPYALTTAMLERLATGEPTGTVDAARQLVDTMTRQYRFLHWQIEFPHIFRTPGHGGGVDPATGWAGGFSCVLTNPPWERIELRHEEFFAGRDQHIVGAEHAAARRRLVRARLADDQGDLRAELLTARRETAGLSHLVRATGRYPLTGAGRLNTYAVFAEVARQIVAPAGTIGAILPTGIATDASTQAYFRDLVASRSLVALHDFENEEKLFTGVDHRVRFALLAMTGAARSRTDISLAFRARQVADVASRSYRLTPEDISLLNPNTGTCPVFLSRRDAEITLDVHRRVPVLWREDDNPWRLSFRQGLFNMATDSALFHTRDRLVDAGWTLDGNVFVRDRARMLPLYEAKMTHHFDHRFGTYDGATEAQLNVGTLPRLDDHAHRDPSRLPLPRYWVRAAEVERRLDARWRHDWLLGWRDVTNAGNERTMVSTVVPRVAVGHKFPLMVVTGPVACLQANLSALVLDYVLRQKFSGTSLAYFVVRQLPVLPPAAYHRPTPWQPDGPDLASWVTDRVLELTYTAHDVTGYATDLGAGGRPYVWDPARREAIRAELDAAYLHLYGVRRDDAEHILDSFPVLRQRDERAHGEYRTKRLVLRRYDAMTASTHLGRAYEPVLDPPPGHGRRHPAGGSL
jgi:hypothetical protein